MSGKQIKLFVADGTPILEELTGGAELRFTGSYDDHWRGSLCR